jgi:hypothetical protein
MGSHGENLSELLAYIEVIWSEIQRQTLIEAFVEWMDRKRECARMNGECVRLAKLNQYITINETACIRPEYMNGWCTAFREPEHLADIPSRAFLELESRKTIATRLSCAQNVRRLLPPQEVYANADRNLAQYRINTSPHQATDMER